MISPSLSAVEPMHFGQVNVGLVVDVVGGVVEEIANGHLPVVDGVHHDGLPSGGVEGEEETDHHRSHLFRTIAYKIRFSVLTKQ